MSDKNNIQNYFEEKENLLKSNDVEGLLSNYNEGFTDIAISELTNKISNEFIELSKNELKNEKYNKDKIYFENGFDWRNIIQENIDIGICKGYGKNLEPGNYVSPVKNQHVPTHTETSWIFSTVSVYSNTYKIAEVASGEKNILDSELARRNLSVQYICDWLGSPNANYKKNMEKERQLIKAKLGSQYRSGSFILCCQVLQDIGVCVYENYNPFVSISRDKPSSGSNWYKIKHYDATAREIKGKYLEGSSEISVMNDSWPSLYPANNKGIYKSGKIYQSDINLVNPFKNLTDYGYDISEGNIEGYTNYKENIIDISYIRLKINTSKKKKEYYNKLSEIIKLFLVTFGPIGISINCWNFYFFTRKIREKQFYTWKDSNKDVNRWYKGEISDKEFNTKYDNSKSNHAVEIVGWTPPNKISNRECWIIKNSWGELWGDNGYLLVPIGINAYNCESHPELLIHNKLLTENFKRIIKEIINKTGYNINNGGALGKFF